MSHSPSPPPLPVLILGAGISGLALAQALLRQKIPFRIFERDNLLNQRSQGYRVRIQSEGIHALKGSLDPELYARLEKWCAIHVGGRNLGPLWQLDALTGEPMQQLLRDSPGSKVPVAEGGDLEPLNADRSVLRSVLMDGMETYVVFGKAFERYEETPVGVKIYFRDGSQTEGRLLVGADGATSQVRRQLLPAFRLLDTKGVFLYGKTVLTKDLETRLNPKYLQGLTVVRDLTQSAPMTLLLEPVRFKDNEYKSEMPDDYIYWVLMNHDGQRDSKLLYSCETNALTEHWHTSFRALFDLQTRDEISCIPTMTAPPKITQWQFSGNVTLIGDAAHVMSPTAGVGAMTALRDAAALSGKLAGENDQSKAVSEYAEMMRGWAFEAISRSQVAGKILFAMPPLEELEPVEGRLYHRRELDALRMS